MFRDRTFVSTRNNGLLIGFIGVVIFILVQNNGSVTNHSADGRYYIHASQTLINEGRFLNHPEPTENARRMAPPNDPFTLWPPGWPVALAVGQWVGIPLNTWIAILNALSIGVIVMCLWIIMNWFGFPEWLQIGLTIAFLTMPVIRTLSTMAVSELPFTALTMLFFVGLILYPRRLFALTMLAGCIVMTRYIGVVVIATGGLFYLLRRRDPLSMTFFVIGSSIPLIAWILRNYTYTGWLMGPRFPAHITTGEATLDYISALVDWSFYAGGLVLIIAGIHTLNHLVRDHL